MSYLLFIGYLVLFCWLLGHIKFIRNTGIDKKIIIGLFLFRIICGMLNGYINLYHYPDTDAAAFHLEGIKEYHLLFNDPQAYLTNMFKKHHENSGLLDITDSFWNNLRSNLMIKLFSVLNIFSGGNFFVNTILYNFLVFFGSVSFYRIYIWLFPGKEKLLIAGLFLLPSLLYFTSGIHKDGLVFLALGLCCYNLFFIIKDRFSIKRIMGILMGLVIIFLLRNFVLITLLPALTAWLIAERNKKFVLQTYIIVYIFFILLFFSVGKIYTALDLPRYVSIRQIEFIHIAKGGQSAININPLYPHFRSFLNNSPQALNHTLMRPYLTEKFTLLYIPVAIEIFIYEILFFAFLLVGSAYKRPDAFIYFGIFFSVSMFLMIGYTIPIIGAIVRYRSIYLPFLIVPILCYMNWDKIRNIFYIKK